MVKEMCPPHSSWMVDSYACLANLSKQPSGELSNDGYPTPPAYCADGKRIFLPSAHSRWISVGRASASSRSWPVALALIRRLSVAPNGRGWDGRGGGRYGSKRLAVTVVVQLQHPIQRTTGADSDDQLGRGGAAQDRTRQDRGQGHWISLTKWKDIIHPG